MDEPYSQDNPDSLAELEQTAKKASRLNLNLSESRIHNKKTGQVSIDSPTPGRNVQPIETNRSRLYADQVIESFEPIQSISSVLHSSRPGAQMLQFEYDFSKSVVKKAPPPPPRTWLLNPNNRDSVNRKSRSRERDILLLAAKQSVEFRQHGGLGNVPTKQPNNLGRTETVRQTHQTLEQQTKENETEASGFGTKRVIKMRKFDPLSMHRSIIKDPFIVPEDPETARIQATLADSPRTNNNYKAAKKEQLTRLFLEAQDQPESTRMMRLTAYSRKSELAKTYSQLGQTRNKTREQIDQDWTNFHPVPLLDSINKTLLPGLAVHSKVVRHTKPPEADMKGMMLKDHLKKQQVNTSTKVDLHMFNRSLNRSLVTVANITKLKSGDNVSIQYKPRQNKSLTRLGKLKRAQFITKKSSSLVYPPEDESSSSIGEEILPGVAAKSVTDESANNPGEIWYTKMNKRKKDLSRDLSDALNQGFEYLRSSLQELDPFDKQPKPMMQDFNDYYVRRKKGDRVNYNQNMSMKVHGVMDGDSLQEDDSMSAAVKEEIMQVLATFFKLPAEEEGNLKEEEADKVPNFNTSLQALPANKASSAKGNVSYFDKLGG